MQTRVTLVSLVCGMVLAAAPAGSSAQEELTEYERAVRRTNLPEWAARRLSAEPLAGRYEVSFWVNPFYLRGDFDGDGASDVAVLVEHAASGNRGIVVMHGGGGDAAVLGAGRTVGSGGDDFRWMNVWRVFPSGEGSGPRTSSMPDDAEAGDALYVAKFGAAGGVIYWNGRRYVWRQRGD